MSEALEIAKKLLRKAQKLVQHRYGVTIIIHQPRLEPGATQMAVMSTLPGRAHLRALCAELLAQSAVADGYTEAQAHGRALADYEDIMLTNEQRARVRAPTEHEGS